MFFIQSKQSKLRTRPALAICQHIRTVNYSAHTSRCPTVSLSAWDSTYLECELHEFRYKTRETLFSHKAKESQQELMARLAREEEGSKFNMYFYAHNGEKLFATLVDVFL